MTCGKIAYASREEALAARGQIKQDTLRFSNAQVGNKDRYKSLNAYQCRYCQQWHLTSQRQLKKPRGPNKRRMER